MHLLPYRQETFVLPYGPQEALLRLQRLTRPVEKGVVFSPEDEKMFLFNGEFKQDRFRISRRIIRPENFLPLLAGRLEGTSKGSLLFIRYRLFFPTALFLIFWSIICFAFTLFFLLRAEAYLYAALACGVGIVQYLVAVKNFSLQVKSSRKVLEKALFEDPDEAAP